MFCPCCATENEMHLKYCRRCGQSLSDVRLALNDNATKALEKLRGGQKFTSGGIATLTAFTLIAVFIEIIAISLGNPSLSAIALINVLLGTIIGLPLVLVGRVSVKRATRLLSEEPAGSVDPTLNPASRESPPKTGLGDGRSVVPASVTENTTLDLRKAEVNREQRM